SEGRDLTVIATSFMVKKALEAAEELAKKGMSIEIIDPCTLVPLDKKMIIESVKKTNRVLVVQEACRRAGFGSELVRIINEECFDYLDSPPLVLGAEEVPIPFCNKLEKLALPQVEDIVETIEKKYIRG
ncbi:MAG: alpha-ketoacid dehydrogenase subunit beta, partial [Actinobacteria bacterium]|nr:alpha-ketoacid dehydrogenase subunit beta [Actinomycetota bacterium]